MVNKIKNIIKAWLRPNPLTEDESDFVAVPHINRTLTEDDIINEMIAEGMELKRETAKDIIARYTRVVSNRIANGDRINTDLVNAGAGIKGVFFNKTWDPEKHKVYAAITPGNVLREAMANTKVEILGEQSGPMAIFGIKDLATGETDGTLTKGKNAEIKGTYIKVAGDNPKNGIVFKNTRTKAEVKLPSENIVLNEPSRLLILVPDNLPNGNYELSVTTQKSSGNALLKEPRTEVFNIPVVIS